MSAPAARRALRLVGLALLFAVAVAAGAYGVLLGVVVWAGREEGERQQRAAARHEE